MILKIPTKTWNLQEFLTNFPHTKVSMVFVALEKYIETLDVRNYPPARPEQKLKTYYVLHVKADDYNTVSEGFYTGVTKDQLYRAINVHKRIIENVVGKIPVRYTLNLKRAPIDDIYFRRAVADVILYFIANVDKKEYAKRLVFINKKVDYLFSKLIGGMYAYYDEREVEFNEIYLENPDYKKVPKFTIIYTRKGERPPIPENVDIDNVEFWSQVFKKHEMGQTILRAVAMVIPSNVTIQVRKFGLKDKIIKNESDHKIFEFIYSNFNIRITDKYVIIVEYNQGRKTVEWKQSAFESWQFFAITAGILLGSALLLSYYAGAGVAAGSVGATTTGTVATSAGAGTAAGAGGTVATTATVAAGGSGVFSIIKDAAEYGKEIIDTGLSAYGAIKGGPDKQKKPPTRPVARQDSSKKLVMIAGLIGILLVVN